MPQQFPAMFIADSAGLDFLNSVATPVDVPIDWIDDGEGLLAWLEQSQLVPVEVLRTMRERAMPGELDRLADQARSLREWFRLFVREHKGRPLGSADLRELEPLNLLLARDEAFGKIVAHEAHGAHEKETVGALTFERSRRWSSPESLLLPIGEILAKLVCEEDFTHVKACEGPTCTLMFADHTRGHARRWCSMAACGNRAKQAAHRNRIKEQS
ncbi:CGNR zinc finger domain-containing protein [Caballeronia sp. LjRoot34]|uniref:CGNR zinc finger domain-containing protein n=1 Tax=Caballeronia sp. LjRoot34 TaxID=3342325 RepID=UPI003ECEC40B